MQREAGAGRSFGFGPDHIHRMSGASRLTDRLEGMWHISNIEDRGSDTEPGFPFLFNIFGSFPGSGRLRILFNGVRR